MGRAWTWLKAHWWAPLAALAALLSFRWLRGRGRAKALESAREVGRTEGLVSAAEAKAATQLETARRAAEARASGAAELKEIRSAIRAAEAESGALSALEVAEAFNRRARDRGK
jgi:hypothetical protein